MDDPMVVSKGSNLYQTTGTLTEIITGCIVSIETEKKERSQKGESFANSQVLRSVPDYCRVQCGYGEFV